MDNISVSKEMERSTLRTEKIVYLATSVTESLAEDARDLLEDSSVEELTKIFGELPEYIVEAIKEGGSEELTMWLIDTKKLGFVVEFATPVREQVGSSKKFWSYSWGYYRTKWIYGDTFDEALNGGIAWANDCERKDKSTAEVVEA